jgi:toxin ParE1/3/4
MPRAGALCGFKSDALREIRRLAVTGFPAHLIFYNFRENQIHILRVLHGARDLERLLSE